MQQQPTQRRRKILLVGLTGSGKSSVGNWIIDGQLFREGDGVEAVTVETVSKNGTFDNVLDVEVIDSPGLQDPMGRDVAHVTAMVEHVKARGEIDLVLLVLNFWKPRFDATLQSMLRIFFKMFRHANMWDNFGIVFTRCYVEQMQERDKDFKRTEFCGKVRSFVDSLGARMACNPPCYFIDTHPEGNDQPTRNERAMLAGLLASLSPMTTSDMEDPGEYLSVEEETQMVITERNSTPVFDRIPIIEKIPLLGKKSGFRVGFGGFSLEFGGGSKVAGYKEVNCGSVSQLAGHTVTEKGVLMKREKRTWYDGKTVSYSPWEVIDNFATDKTEKV